MDNDNNRGYTAPPSDIAKDFDILLTYEKYMDDWLTNIEYCWEIDSDGNEIK